MKIKVCTIIFTLLFAMGCSKTDDTVEPEKPVQKDPPKDEPTVEVLTGAFIDGAVEGLTFSTATQSGVTNENGEFKYIEGEEITFKVGEVIIGSVGAKAEITPIDIAQDTDASATIDNSVAKNIAAFLQTLDDDQNHDNGIEITNEIASAIGVTEINFSNSIVPVLADVVVNVSKQTGKILNIVYPEHATINMATSLELEYTPKEQLWLSHLLPTVESYYAHEVPKSAVYKNTFDADDKIVSTTIMLRYSGSVLYEITYGGHNDVNLPTTLTLNRKRHSLLDNGWSYPMRDFLFYYTLSYNTNNQLQQITEIDNPDVLESSYTITAWNDQNQILSYNHNGVDYLNIRNDTYEYANEYDTEGKLTKQQVTHSIVVNDVEFGYYSNEQTTSTVTYAFNDQLNFSKIATSKSSSYSYNYEGETPISNSYNFEGSNDYIYRDNGTLENRSLVEDYIYTDTTVSANSMFLYNEEDLLLESSYESNTGDKRNYSYESGYITNIENYNNDLLTYEVTYNVDGSFVDHVYQYDDNLNIVGSYAREWALMPGEYYGIIKTEYFDAAGMLTNIVSSEFYEDGTIKETRNTAENGDIIWRDLYDESGRLIKTEYYNLGILNYTYIYEYDANGQRIKAEGYDANNELNYVEYYNEFGFTSSYEFYDNGVLESRSVYNYSDNGVPITTNIYDGQGNLIKVDYFDENGGFEYYEFFENNIITYRGFLDDNYNLIRAEYFDAGVLYAYDIFENNENGQRILASAYDSEGNLSYTLNYSYAANGSLETIHLYLSDGVLYSIDYFENDILIRIDYYDAEGNIIETYTPTGKSINTIVDKRTDKISFEELQVLNKQSTLHNKTIQFNMVKRNHSIIESNEVKRIVKSKYELMDMKRHDIKK